MVFTWNFTSPEVKTDLTSGYDPPFNRAVVYIDKIFKMVPNSNNVQNMIASISGVNIFLTIHSHLLTRTDVFNSHILTCTDVFNSGESRFGLFT